MCIRDSLYAADTTRFVRLTRDVDSFPWQHHAIMVLHLCREFRESRMAWEKQPCVYLLAGKRNGTLYVGVTSDLVKRVWEHKNDLVEGFTAKYGVHLLVYYDCLLYTSPSPRDS